MNHWAFVNALWIGEGFSYDSLPVYWLAQISGLAFGVFSDMLGEARIGSHPICPLTQTVDKGPPAVVVCSGMHTKPVQRNVVWLDR
jgi:hypothetical protein